jgi:D-serine deaminase-like pyridoxal phosphate-dependent protein
MVFHQPFLTHIAQAYPKSDVLMGKPLPVQAAKAFYLHLQSQSLDSQNHFEPKTQLQWLIDSEERLKQYLTLAQSLDQHFKINIELDVGLHRGGLQQADDLDALIAIIEDNSQYLSFAGFMGYDLHVVKLHSIVKSAEQALCLNGAGSPSLLMHKQNTVANEVSAGSCFVKPVDFDIPSLSAFKPAAFIATLILKKITGTLLPTVEFAQNLFPLWDPNMQQTYFIYGGKWLAKYESPQGLQGNGLFGTSTNQDIVNSSKKVDLNVDDHIFLRPTQSEFVFLQFGSLITLRNQHVDNQWLISRQR